MSNVHPAGMLPESVTADQAEKLMATAMQPTPESSPGPAWTMPTAAEVAPWFPDCTVEALIGRGAMGAVYRAVQTRLGRTVAIKLLPPELAAVGDFAARFEREARAMAQLSHPNIVAVHDFGRTPAGHAFIVMEFVEGADLSRLIQNAGSGLSVAQALRIVSETCEALQYAHGRGCIHRDIKPQNVLVDTSGRVKIADFGLAKLVGPHPSVYGHTATGAVLGTPEYVAPEQLKGGAVDHRADIYSLGVMFYEMLTGDLPRGAWEPPSERIPAADTRIDEVVRRAMQREPDRRYQECSEVKTDVNRVQAGPPPAPEKRPASPSRLPARIVGVILLAVAWFASRLTPTGNLLTVLFLAGPFLLLGAAFFFWPRPIRWWGGLIAGLAVLPVAFLFGTTAAQMRREFADGAPQPAPTPDPLPSAVSATIQGEADRVMTELGTIQDMLDRNLSQDGEPLTTSNVTGWETRLSLAAKQIERLTTPGPANAPPILSDLRRILERVLTDYKERAAALTSPEALASQAENELKLVENELTSTLSDPFHRPRATLENLQRIQTAYRVPDDNPRLSQVRRLLASRDEFESLAQRVHQVVGKLEESAQRAANLPWEKLEPEQRTELTKRWDAAIAEAEELRKNPRAIDIDQLPALIAALEKFKNERPDKPADPKQITPPLPTQ